MQHGQVEQVGGDRLAARRKQRERQLAALVEDRARRRAIRVGSESRLRPRHSASVWTTQSARSIERQLDFAQRHPARRANDQAAMVDQHADRAAAGADQPIVDLLPGEHHAACAAFADVGAGGRSAARALGARPADCPAARPRSRSRSRPRRSAAACRRLRVGSAGRSTPSPCRPVCRTRPWATDSRHYAPPERSVRRAPSPAVHRRSCSGRACPPGCAFLPGRRRSRSPAATARGPASTICVIASLPGLAVDGYRRGQREGPAEERDRQELLLGDERERRKQEIERQRLPGRAVLRHHDVRIASRRDVLGADGAMADAADQRARRAG